MIKIGANLANLIEDMFKNIPGYIIDLKKPFTFRVWTEFEFNKIVKQTDYTLID